MDAPEEKILADPLYKALEHDAEKLRFILEKFKRETGIEKPLDLILEDIPSPDKLIKKSVGKEIAKSIGKGLAIGALPAIIAGGITDYLVGLGVKSPMRIKFGNAYSRMPLETQEATGDLYWKLVHSYTPANRGAAYGALTTYHNMKIKGRSKIKTFLKRIAGWVWVIPIIVIRLILEYLVGIAPNLSPEEARFWFQTLYTLYISTEFIGACCAVYNIAMGARSIANDVRAWNEYVRRIKPRAEAKEQLLRMMRENTVVLSKIEDISKLYSVAVYLEKGRIKEAFEYIRKELPEILVKATGKKTL